MSNVQIFFTIIFFALLMGGIGYAIGSIKDNRKSGFWLGAILGPIGLTIIFLLTLTSQKKPPQIRFTNTARGQFPSEILLRKEQGVPADLRTFITIYLLIITINTVIWACILSPHGAPMFFVNIAYGALFFPISFLVFAITIFIIANKGRNRSFIKNYEILAILALNILCIMTIGIESCAPDHYDYNFFELLLEISDRNSCDKALLQSYSDEATYFPQFSYFVLTTIVFMNLIKRAYKSSCANLP